MQGGMAEYAAQLNVRRLLDFMPRTRDPRTLLAIAFGIRKPYKTKCRIYVCNRRPALCGYCREHYERDIRPYSYLTRKQLSAFIEAVQQILEEEFRISLPATVLQSNTAPSKEQLRVAYQETQRYVDTHLRPALFRKSYLAQRPHLQTGDGAAWEQISVEVAKALFGQVLLHPRLPNNKRPDIVPRLPGIRLDKRSARPAHLLYAPVVVEAKRSALHGDVRSKYGPHARRVEVWLYGWRPHWRVYREPDVKYQSPIELARRLERGRHRSLASLLRSLPLLWRDYQLLPHYLRGLPKRQR
jgi:hypothetical protein